MRTHSDIIATADAADLAERCGVSIHTVRSWGQRNSVPAGHWLTLAQAKLATLEELAEGAKPRSVKVAA